MSTMNEALNNLERAVENGVVDVEGTMNIVMTDAYAQSKKVDKHLQEVKDELDDRAEAVITENPGTGTEIKNEYTAKLALEESFEEFSIQEAVAPKKQDGRSHRQSVDDENDGDRYLDYDMFTFVHELFAGQDCNTNPAPMTPVIYGPMESPEEKKRKLRVKRARAAGKDPKEEDLVPLPPVWGMRKMRKYLDAAVEDASDDVDARAVRVPQIASDGSTLTISARKRLDLHDVPKACEIFKLECSEIKPYKNAYWNFYIDVKIPEIAPGYPMLLADYLEDIGMDMRDVMSKSFCDTYDKRIAKENDLSSKRTPEQNDAEVKRLLNKAITTASNDQEPLEVHKERLIADLTAAGLKFNPNKISKAFDAEFDYEWDKEDDDE